jgi:tRNA pseudouridine55 synthase
MTSSGIILIDKPEGPSSAQVVHRAKKILQAKKIGHLGTLDPFASGLLLLGVNEGTKIADIFLGAPKSYRAVMVLGQETDTQDGTGQVLQTRPVPTLTDRDLKALENRFTGELAQIPPMFSALKKDGVRLYQLARQGKEVAREPRQVTIRELQLRQLNGAEIEFDVTCSRGTYIRTLAHDMGNELGCGAHLRALRRTACGHLKIEEAVTVELLESLVAQNQSPLVSLSNALAHLPEVVWDNRSLSRLRQGQQEALFQLPKPVAGELLIRIGDGQGNLVALAQWTPIAAVGRWQLARVFRE